MTIRCPFCIALLISFIGQMPVQGRQPLEPGASDEVEVLPERALARLGTIRFRHGAPITSLAISNDGKYLASGSRDGTARVWEMDSGKLLRSIRCETVSPAGVAFSPDGKELLTNIDSEHLSRFEWLSNKPPRVAFAAPAPQSLAWSSDGKTIGCEVADDESLQVRDAASGKMLFGVKKANRIAFALAGNKCAISLLGGAIKILSLPDGVELKALPAPEENSNVLSLCFNPDSRFLIVAYLSGTVAVWDCEAAKRLYAVSASGPVALVPGQASFAAIDKGHLAIFDLKTGERRLRVAEALDETPFVILPDGNRVALAGPGNRIRVWNMTTGVEQNFGGGHENEVTAIGFTSDGTELLSGGADGLRLWDVSTYRERASGKRSVPVQAISISPSKRSFATSDRNAINIWAPLHFDKDKPYADRPTLVMPTKIERASVLVHTPDGNRVLFADAERNLVFADPRRGAIFAGLALPADPLAAAFDYTGRRLVVHTRDGWLRNWIVAVRDGRDEKDLDTWTKRVQRGNRGAVAYSPSGLLVAAYQGGSVVLLDSATGHAWPGFHREFGEGNVQAVAFSPDEKFIAAGYAGPDGFVRIWEVATGKEVIALRNHAGGVNAIAFAPGGKMLASAGSDSAILLWNFDFTPSLQDEELSLSGAWDVLDTLDAKKAYLAMNSLLRQGQKAVATIENGVDEWSKTEPRIREWIKDLDSDEFRVRKAARNELDKQGRRALPFLQEALTKKLPIDTERQIRLLIEDFDSRDIRIPESGLYGEQLRTVRSIRALERIGGADAARLLEKWAQTKNSDRVAAEASAALEYIRR